ncbi:MAG: ABC transporter substrate-binding protein [SAR324 cluster bacterium]|uniref:ABC transporter substrate-binding protein n=1 Tax=SAR324 cluster bacterium TaxID=2024889 RepID=A0A2A4T7C1_9DELT|nr:MAG: ABC transporter substrate-binding protein [SAR324 cluster bacterium]
MKSWHYFLFLGISLWMSPIVMGKQLELVTIQGSGIAEITSLILRQAYKQIGIGLTITYLPAQRALIESNEGIVDGEVHRILGIEKRYPNLIRIPVSIWHMKGVVFTKNVTFEVKGWQSLEPYRIGTLRGVKFVENNTQGMNRLRVRDYTQLFLMLADNRLDIVVLAQLSGLKALKATKAEGIRILSPPLTVLKLYHYLHRKNLHLIPEITKALKEMEQQGKIRAIWQQYLK